jgi:putative flippase GtrA
MVKQALKFALVGCGSGVVNFLAYNGALAVLRALGWLPRRDYLVALGIGFVLSVLWSFVMSRKFVFTAPEEIKLPWHQSLIKMYVVYGITGLGLSSLLSMLWISVMHLPKEIITILNDIICFPVTFLLNKFWTFRKTKL